MEEWNQLFASVPSKKEALKETLNVIFVVRRMSNENMKTTEHSKNGSIKDTRSVSGVRREIMYKFVGFSKIVVVIFPEFFEIVRSRKST